ncbi:MAG: dienelactone hydrolase family protein [Caulobacteraceae bacterium]|jgi:carboxymethylenebutenolidase|nr:dienelactone hydrolase family protein [Caulobacteraceae bacterium]
MKLKSKADGFEFEAYHVAPKDARRGGLVLIQEIFGVTQGIRELADSFAEDGYEVLAPQMFDRCERNFDAKRDADGIAKGRGYVQEVGFDRALGDVQTCIDVLNGPVFITGFCYGGTIAWLAACRCTGLTAASAYYGGGISGFVAETPKIPVILHFGKKDAHITSEHRDKITAAHPDVPLFLYEADHGFFSHDRDDYDPDPARLSRLRTLQLFHQAASGKVEA